MDKESAVARQIFSDDEEDAQDGGRVDKAVYHDGPDPFLDDEVDVDNEMGVYFTTVLCSCCGRFIVAMMK